MELKNYKRFNNQQERKIIQEKILILIMLFIEFE